MTNAQLDRLLEVLEEGNRVQAELAAQVAELSERVVVLLEIMLAQDEGADPDSPPARDMAGRIIGRSL